MNNELKAYIGPAPDEKGLADYYLKSEADKVIADKDKEIARLKDKCQMPQPQRWMTSENPPQNMREVLICVPIRGHLAVCLGHYNYSSRQWFLHDRYDPTEVAYWSEKPFPPEK